MTFDWTPVIDRVRMPAFDPARITRRLGFLPTKIAPGRSPTVSSLKPTADRTLMSRQRVLNQLAANGPIIAPSVLKCDFGNLAREIELLSRAETGVLHLDVMDGRFVPNLSYGPMVIERLRDLTTMTFDAHLMISDPARYLDDYVKAGCDAITFHVEAETDARPLLRRIKEAGVVAGLAVNPGTSIERIADLLPECDLVLVMSVEPGFGGQSFIPDSLDKIRQLTALVSSETVISVDGGIGPVTIAAAAEAGASLFVAGSAVFDQPDYRSAIAELRELARGVKASS